jgi:hypothetical protein
MQTTYSRQGRHYFYKSLTALKLENISMPQIPMLQYMENLKLTILSTKKSSKVSFRLLAFPLIILLEGICESVIHILLPPWGWLVKYSPVMPLWLRMLIYIMVLIVLPLTAVYLNILAVTWFKYDKEQTILNISIRLMTINLIIIIMTTIIALLFIGHTIAEWINGAS